MFTPQNFVDKGTVPISAAWLNGLDQLCYSVLGGAQTPAALAPFLGSSIYPPHPGEIAAGVTIVSTTVPYGYVQRYGAANDSGVTLNQTPFQQALTANAGYYPVIVESNLTGGGYFGGFTTLLNIPANSHIIFRDRPELRMVSSTPGSGPNWLGAASRPFLNVQGNNVRFQGAALISGPTQQTGANGLPGGTVAGGTFTNLEMGLMCIGASINAPITSLYIGPQIEFRWFGHAAIALQYVEDFEINGTKLHDCGYAGILGLSCNKGEVWGNKIQYIDPGAASGVPNAYGISFSANSQSATAGSSRTDPDRFSMAINVWANTVEDIPRWSGIDAHGGYELNYHDNKVYNCLNGVHIGSFTNGAPATYGSENCTISNNKCRTQRANGSATTIGSLTGSVLTALGFNLSGGANGNALNGAIIGNVSDGYGSLNAGIPSSHSIQASFTSYIRIIGNNIASWTGYGIFLSGSPSVGGLVNDNTFGVINTAYAHDSCIFSDFAAAADQPQVAGNVHNILAGTPAHFGLLLHAGTTLAGPNDFSAATTAAYGNDNTGVAAPASFFKGFNVPGPIGLNGAAAPAQVTGFGTPTGTGVIANFPGATATLAQTSQAVAQLIADLKALGLYGA